MKRTLTLLSSLLLDVGLVSGNDLGSMGKPITKVCNDQQIKFC